MNRAWSDRSDCRVSRALWPSLKLADFKHLLGMSRGRLRVIVGMVTGHFSIGNMMSKWNIGMSDFCRTCDDVKELETVEHILCHCVGLQRSR